jgi:hypothetical protein
MNSENLFRAIGGASDESHAIVERALQAKPAKPQRSMLWSAAPAAAAAVVLTVVSVVLFQIYRADPSELPANTGDSGTTTAASTSEPPPPDDFSFLGQFLEFLEQSGMEYNRETTHVTVGENGLFHMILIKGTEQVYISDFFTLEAAYNGFLAWSQSAGFVYSRNTTVISYDGNDEDVIAFLQYHYADRPDDIPPTPDIEGVTWIVEPTLQYRLDGIGYCEKENAYFNWEYSETSEIIDERTGQLTGRFTVLCNRGEYGWCQYCRYARREFTFDVVKLGGWETWNIPDYGIVDMNGRVLVPHAFDQIIIIDEKSAFAYVAGFWGIVAIPDAPPMPAPVVIDGVTWLIPPTVEQVWFCRVCDVFGNDGLILNERTARVSVMYGGGHCGSGNQWVYDRERDLLGLYRTGLAFGEIEMYPVSEFMQRFPHMENRIAFVHLVDSSLRDEHWDGTGAEHLLREAYSGKVAVMINGVFLTDFIYDGSYEHEYPDYTSTIFIDNEEHGRIVGDSVVLILGGKYGVMNGRGEVVIPFEFERIFVINDTSAFAQRGGKWGIITW